MEKPALILIPGTLCDATLFRHQLAALAARAYVTVADLFDLPDIAAMAERILDAAPPRFILLGFSLGGRVALEIVRRAPDRVQALILLAVGIEPSSPEEISAREAMIDNAHRLGMRSLAKSWPPELVSPRSLSNRPMMRALEDMIARATPEQFELQQRALIHRPDAMDAIRVLNHPTAILCGAEDSYFTPDQHRKLAAAISGARLGIVPRSGHFVPLEAPEALNMALIDLLKIITMHSQH